jgi:hypothetical protein
MRLTLYVADHSTTSTQAIEHLQQAIERLGGGDVQLELVSVSESPHRALRERVLVTPTLVADGLRGRVVGDLSDPDLLDYFLRSIET